MSDQPTVLLSRKAGNSEGVCIPEKIGAVRLIRQIGSGGMGVVWLAHHELLARDVAVKFLVEVDKKVSEGLGFDAFMKGAQSVAAIRHSALTAIFDAGAISGVPYLVMEYVDGTTLADVLRLQGALPLSLARTVLAATCEGVAELHDHDVVHRDIKPSNILVARDGSILVTDFGLTCDRYFARTDRAVPGQPTGIAGTPAYMAPEMFSGDLSLGSDVYALGVTTFELLTGKLPSREILANPGDQSMPPRVFAAIEQSMRMERRFRPKSARRFRDMLDAAFAEEHIPAGTDEDVRRFVFSDRVPEPASSGPREGGGPTAPLSSALTLKRSREGPAPRQSLIPTEAAHSGLRGPIRIPLGHMFACALIGALALGVLLWRVLPQFGDEWGDTIGLGDLIRGQNWSRDVFWNTLLVLAAKAACIALATVFMITIYRRHDVTRRAGSPGRVCGWCGHRGVGLWAQRCPECGRDILDHGKPMDRPPAQQWWPYLRSLGLATAVLEGTLLVILGLSPLSIFIACVAGIGVYHVSSRSTMPLDGLVRCGACGAQVSFAGQSVCTRCSAAL